ncbi:hypothetical protein AB838_06240 [Rhodobacteraceae bacterium (ex Bugula neritina AB1)]|nr:hypothetical protein AB838_06240 [Rhodobacteraceae bacterium (ex Bugula neritina AB1)]
MGWNVFSRNLIILVLCEGLAFSLMAAVLTICAAAGYNMAPNKHLVLLPLTTEVIGSCLSTIPAAFLMRRLGRRPAFVTGSLVAAAGGAACCYAVYTGSFWLLVVSTPFLGALSGFGEYTRYAAAELFSSPDQKRQAVSFVVSSGILAAFLGPAISRWTNPLLPIPFLAPFGVCVLLCLASAALYLFLQSAAAQSRKGDTAPSEPLRKVLLLPAFVTGTVAAVVSFLAMAVVMDATPMTMFDCGFDYSDTTQVIQWHFLAMFAPSVLTPRVIRLIGSANTIILGIVFSGIGLCAGFAGVAFANFLVVMIMIGIGWNLMFIAGTSLLATMEAGLRRTAEGASNFLVSSSFAVATPIASVLAVTYGWEAVCSFAAVMLGIAFLAILALQKKMASGGIQSGQSAAKEFP